MSEVFTIIFGVMTYAAEWMQLHTVPGTPITFYELWVGGFVATGIIDALKTFLPNQEDSLD